MGRDVEQRTFTHEDRRRYRAKLDDCLAALDRMLRTGKLSDGQQTMGLEAELNLVDADLEPAMANAEVLERIADPSFQTELGQHNIEINLAPRTLAGDESRKLERELRAALNAADSKARNAGATLAMIGILPTLRPEHLDPRSMSVGSRYAMLNDALVAARGEDLTLDIEGVALDGREPERLHTSTGSILHEAACTSVQLHLQVSPEGFAAHWNAAQCVAGAQVALAANSPFLHGRALWAETRVPLFLQSIDTRTPELRAQGVRPRVWFGQGWIGSALDLFGENLRYFTPLLPETGDEDPDAVLDAGGAPELAELVLHNGTVWRWNRPIYDVADGAAHLRLENRLLPAGPTVADVLANAAFFYGTVRALAQQQPPVWERMSFSAAEENFYAGAKHGLDAELYWPGMGLAPADELVLRRLLPLAHEGLRNYGMSDGAREQYLGIVERRCIHRRCGAAWQRETVRGLERHGDRSGALRGMLRRYLEFMHSNEPVHTWPVSSGT